MALKVALLGGRKLMVEKYDVCLGLSNRSCDFIRLAASRKVPRIRFAAASCDQSANLKASRFRQALKLFGAFRIVGRIKIE
jgi:hypothetical protein